MLSQLTRLPRGAKVLILVGIDSMLGAIAIWSAMLLRLGGVPRFVAHQAEMVTLLAMVLVPLIGFACNIYRPVIRFAVPRLWIRVAMVSLACGGAIALIAWLGGARFSRAVGFGGVFALTLFALHILSRHIARWILYSGPTLVGTPIAVYGAGAAGRQLVALLRETRDFAPLLFIDDDASLRGRAVEDLIVRSPDDPKLGAALAAKGVQEIFLAIPSLNRTRRREILEKLAQWPYRVRIAPGLGGVVRGEQGDLAGIRDVSIEDLLGRDVVAPLPGLLDRCVKGKSVLVTGGGGSIGAELCRQVLALQPATLIVLEHSEFALYRIEKELVARALTRPGSKLHFVLGSINDPARLESLLREFAVDTVYHAAAYKHVPIVEANPVEGLRNNVLGTWYLAKAAARTKVSHFVFISSDKAVRPTNVMGATKRMAELVVQVLAEQHRATVFSMVRFGNVLESSGSVVPLFRDQIQAGGPVTLTHPEVMRYFMTIEEAVQLVIQAGAMASGGEVFLLDMGAPVKIRDLACRMISLSGRSVRDENDPRGDIAIETIGLRPGEKLFEELIIGSEAIPTAHPRIWRAQEKSADAAELERELRAMESLAGQRPPDIEVRRLLARWVDGYSCHEPRAGGPTHEQACQPASQNAAPVAP